MPRKTRDPVLIGLLDKAKQAQEEFDRWYRRARRAFTAMEKARRRLSRLQRRIAQHNPQEQ
jgi:hypothetical protein